MTDNSEKSHEMKEEYLINEPTAQSIYKDFEDLYEKALSNLKNNKFDLNSIENNYDKFKSIKSKDVKFIIANVGYPNTQKSSFFNYLLTGSSEFPLPNSPKSGVSGETLKPTRCFYTNSDKISIRTNRKENDKMKLFDSFDKTFHQYIKEFMADLDIEEIVIEIPKLKYPQQSAQFENFVFLDLIGLPNQDAQNFQDDINAVKLNKLSIERELIDAIFLFPGNRNNCETKLIKELWKIGAFSNLDEMRPPKIIVTAKYRSGDSNNETDLNDRLNGFCQNLHSMQRNNIKEYLTNSIGKIFDYSCLNESTDEVIDIENKDKNVKELVSRADTICALEMNSSEIIYEQSAFNCYQKHLQLIIDDIKHYKHDWIYKESFAYIVPAIKELSLKMDTKIRSNKIRKNDQTLYINIEKYFSSDKYNKLLKQNNNDITNAVNEIKRAYEEQEDNELYLNEDAYDYESCKKAASDIRFNQIFDAFLATVAKIYYKFNEGLKISLEKKFKIDEWNSKVEVDLDETMMKLKILTNDSRKKALSEIIKGVELERKFSKIKQLVLLQSSESQKHFIPIIELEQDANINGLIKLNEKLIDFHKKTNEKLKFFYEIIQSVDSKHVKPILYQVANSNKLPKIEDFKETLSLKKIKNYYTRYPNSCPKKGNQNQWKSWENMLEKGREKSTLSLLHRNNPETDHIQFYINRDNKEISVEYNQNFINERLNLLNLNIYNKDKASLNPIFISSVLRLDQGTKSEDMYSDDLNILSKTLGCHLEPNSFLIFLFIEAGVPSNRNGFNKELNYYKKLKDKNFKAILEYPNSKYSEQCYNPVILCYLPERNLGIGRKRKIMMLFAEHFMLRRFYFIDDDIESFYEYDEQIGHRKMVQNEYTTFRSLDFMLKVLEEETSNNVFESDTLEDMRNEIAYLQRSVGKKNKDNEDYKNYEYLTRLLNIFQKNEVIARKSEVFNLLNKIKFVESEDSNNEINAIKEKLLGSKSKIIGQIALWNKSSYQSANYSNRLQIDAKNSIKTHLISSERYQVILYNSDAIKGIHPVSDDAFFVTPLDKKEKCKLVNSFSKRDFSNRIVCEAAELGYKCSDKAHVFYQILNYVSGFLVYYFSFEPNRSLKSKVNSDETDSEI